jgi:pimeloyl-ACP methyl ester carboxylesterase
MIAGCPTRFITLEDNTKTRMLDTGGEGTPILLLHGISASIEAWEEVIPELAKTHRVLAFDLLGMGEADKPNIDYRYPVFVEQTRRFLNAVGVEKAHFVGSSMGASLIIRFSDVYPEQINRAVLAAPGGFANFIHPFLRFPTIPIIGWIGSRPLRITNSFAVRLTMGSKATVALVDLTDRLSREPGAHRAFVRTLKGIASIFGLKDRPSFEQQASAFRSDALIIWGKQDKIFPVKQASLAKSLLPNSTLRLMEDCGHFPQLSHPKIFSSWVLQHLAQEQEK